MDTNVYIVIMIILALLEVFTAQGIVLLLATAVAGIFVYGMYFALPYLENISPGLIFLGIMFFAVVFGQISYLKDNKNGNSSLQKM